MALLVVAGWVLIDIENDSLLTIAISSGCVPIMEYACQWMNEQMNEWINEAMTETTIDSWSTELCFAINYIKVVFTYTTTAEAFFGCMEYLLCAFHYSFPV
jgi:hypothetical protein